MTILESFVKEILNEVIEKRGKRWYVISHKIPGKILGKKEGYRSKKKAIIYLLGAKSRGGFYNLPRKDRNKRIKSYIKNH